MKHLRTSNLFSWQKHVLSLDGPVLTASGFKEKLAVVTHVFDYLSSNDQVGSLSRLYLVFIFNLFKRLSNSEDIVILL